MTVETEKRSDMELETFFDALRDAPDAPSPDLLARVLADAYAEQDAQSALLPTDAAVSTEPRRRGWLRGILVSIGGWPAVAGLATATLAGVWIGYNPPAAFDALTLAFMDSSYGSYGAGLGDALPSYADLLADG